MKKKIIAVIVAVTLLVVGFATVPVMADSATPQLSRVQITPSNTTLLLGATQQFTAQAYDVHDQPVTNVTYFWLVAAGGGSINATGLFTALSPAGSVGTYNDTVEVVAVQGKIMKLDNATVTLVASIGALASIKVTPATVTVAPLGTQQFNAQGYDAANTPIPGLTYSWAGAGSASVGALSASGLFTAGSTTGTYNIQATVPASPAIAAGTATVTVATTPTPNPEKLGRSSLFGVLKDFLKNIGSDNFLGGQWQVKNGTNADTIKMIPGVVKTVSATTLVITPNGQTADSTFALPTGTVILPNGTTLAAGDKVMVITVNDQVTTVVKMTPISTSGNPPGLNKHDDDKRDGKNTPPGWSKGKKTGWSKDHSNNNDQNSQDNED